MLSEPRIFYTVGKYKKNDGFKGFRLKSLRPV